jgi:hypothetical protein
MAAPPRGPTTAVGLSFGIHRAKGTAMPTRKLASIILAIFAGGAIGFVPRDIGLGRTLGLGVARCGSCFPWPANDRGRHW